MTMPCCGINLVENENTPLVQKYLGQGEEYLKKGKLHNEEGPLGVWEMCIFAIFC